MKLHLSQEIFPEEDFPGNLSNVREEEWL